MTKIIPYKRFSKSAKLLASGLGIKRVITPTYRQRQREVLINWGNSRLTQTIIGKVYNHPNNVGLAVNKLFAFNRMKVQGVSIPEHTICLETANGWLTEGFKVVSRAILNGRSGIGAKIVKRGEILPIVPLYTKYIPKDAEYRVHVLNSQIIDFCRKKKRHGYENDALFNPHIRTHNNGWVFCRCGVILPECVKEEAFKAIKALGLDFGAIDVIYVRSSNKAYVLEVNTAPGLDGTTLQKYIDNFRRLLYNR